MGLQLENLTYMGKSMNTEQCFDEVAHQADQADHITPDSNQEVLVDNFINKIWNIE